MIEYILKVVPYIVDGTTPDFHTSAIGEIWKALSVLFTYVPETQSLFLIKMFIHAAKFHLGERMLGVLLPVIALLLDSPLPASLNAQVVTHLLMLATSAPLSFKEAAKKLDPTMHKLLQQSVQRAVGNAPVVNTPSIKPQISLRSF
jgi:HEAT repeat-containing protein 5